ncbi:hypothetical protein R3P38DRAFT_3561778 [Favolaschia claudopus]|uniref:Gag protein n=1 Tax=Favolaschia claudopus TaxID=2862362 RepID=A0AAW0AUK9_9AGAR
MSTLPSASTFSKSEEETIRMKLKTLRATHYEDPMDQKMFLEHTALCILDFRSKVDAFALNAELAQIIFVLRSALHDIHSRAPNPPSVTYPALVAFANEIIQRRQTIIIQTRATVHRLSGIEAARVRAERRQFLKDTTSTISAVKDDDMVSIPSSDTDVEPSTPAVEVSTVGASTVLAPPPSPIQVLLSAAVPVAGNTEPVAEPPAQRPNTRPTGLTIITRPIPTGPRADRNSSNKRPRIGDGDADSAHPAHIRLSSSNAVPRNLPIHAPIPRLATRDPRHLNPAYTHLLRKVNSAGVLPIFKPNSTGSRAPRNMSRGNFKSLSKAKPKASKPRKPKRCYKCLSEWHLVASCPALKFVVN